VTRDAHCIPPKRASDPMTSAAPTMTTTSRMTQALFRRSGIG